MSETLRKLFPYLIPAALCLYVGTHLLWRGLGGHAGGRGFVRGVLLAVPVALLAGWFAGRGAGDVGVAVILSACVLMLTLVLGACAMSDPHDATTNGPSFGLLAPLAAATLLIGFTGELQYAHAAALTLLGGVLIWAKPRPVVSGDIAPRKPAFLLGSTVLLAAGVVGMALVGEGLLDLSMSQMAGPIILPLVLLAAIGLLVGDVHHAQGTSAAETIGAFVASLLGFALPIVIVVARVRSMTLLAASTQPTTEPTTGSVPAIVMPWTSWRVDAVVLLIISLLLLPVATGRIRLGRVEGLFLVIACVVYISITVLATRA